MSLPSLPDPDPQRALVQRVVTMLEHFGLVNTATAARLLTLWPGNHNLTDNQRAAVLAHFTTDGETPDVDTLVQRAADAARHLPGALADEVLAIGALLLVDDQSDEPPSTVDETALRPGDLITVTIRGARVIAADTARALLVIRTPAGQVLGITCPAPGVAVACLTATAAETAPAPRPVDLVDRPIVPDLWPHHGTGQPGVTR